MTYIVKWGEDVVLETEDRFEVRLFFLDLEHPEAADRYTVKELEAAATELYEEESLEYEGYEWCKKWVWD